MSVAWPTRELRELAQVRVSNVDKKTHPSEHPIKLCNYMDVYSNDYVTSCLEFMEASATSAEIERFALNSGDVVITKDSETPDDIGIAAVIMEQIDHLVCGYHLALIRPKANELDSIYLAKQLSSSPVARYFAVHAGGSTRYGLPVSVIESVAIPTPPKPEQTKIAEILSTLDRAIEETEALIAKQQRIKTGLMQDLLTRGIDEHGNIRSERTHEFKNSALGKVPVQWEVAPLGEAAHIIDPNPTHRYPPPCDDGVPIASTENFESDNEFDLTGCENVPWSVYESQSKRCGYKATDVVFARKGRLGFARPYGDAKKVFSHTVVIIKPRRGAAIAEFLLWVVRDDQFLRRITERMNSNSGVPTLGVQFLSAIPVLVPQPPEQQRIAQTLSRSEAAMELEQRSLTKLHCLKVALMQDLLTGRRRVTDLLASQPGREKVYASQ